MQLIVWLSLAIFLWLFFAVVHPITAVIVIAIGLMLDNNQGENDDN